MSALRRMNPRGPEPSGDQSPQQALNARARTAIYGFSLVGLEPLPSEDEVKAALRTLGGRN